MDRDGWPWIFSVPERHRLSIGAFYMLNKKNGLNTNEFNGSGKPSYQWLSDSALVLPSIDGMAEFQPQKLPIVLPDRPIYIDEILLNGKTKVIDSAKKYCIDTCLCFASIS